ncbi:putative ankyrin repeat domain-containing protein 30B-like [Nycticebus coucang]|uniref:putative ankyrin repeat domain-containing protein 30B-like n=1 Tax=Nycticebus coucang TaxID=9470 RepID=UPI00234C7991|nr:putative ankyrin repeat domain-containing protein 30B-like [Nycticebus coucang]
MKKIFSPWSKQRQPAPGFVTSLRKIRGSVACDTGSIDETFTQPRYHIRAQDLGKIHKAASGGQVGKVQQLLFLGKSDVNERDKKRRTALHLACANGHIEVVKFLLSRKCEVDMGDNEDRTPLMKAIQHQETECAFNLLDYGADPNITDDYGNTALHYAVYSGNIVLITKLLSCGANIETKNKKQLTPLLLAINGKNLKMVEFLVKNKADINAVDKYESISGTLDVDDDLRHTPEHEDFDSDTKQWFGAVVFQSAAITVGHIQRLGAAWVQPQCSGNTARKDQDVSALKTVERSTKCLTP